jgi:hypothetical protein
VPKSRDVWGEIRDIARHNHGLIDRGTILAVGATDHFIKSRLLTRHWEEVHPGVYYLNVTPRTWVSEVVAAVLGAGPDAVASHRTAARIWDLDGVYGTTIEVTVPYDDRPVPDGVLVHRTRRSLPSTLVDGVPVTSPERTLLDLAAILPNRILERAMASAIRRSLTSIEKLRQAVKAQGGRGVKGTRRMRRVTELVEGDQSGSVSEVELKDLLRDAPVPMPVPQLHIRLPNGDNAYPDFAWPERMKIVEVDGFSAHSTPDQLEHDLRRQNQLMQLGWEIRRFSARDVRRNPHEVVGAIVDFLGEDP